MKVHIVIALALASASLSVAQAKAQSLTPPQRTIPAPTTVSPADTKLREAEENYRRGDDLAREMTPTQLTEARQFAAQKRKDFTGKGGRIP